MKKELKIACKWWADQLRFGAKQDNGDFMQSALMGFVAKKLDPLSEGQILKFERELFMILEDSCKDNWDDEEPIKGSYLRCVGVD